MKRFLRFAAVVLALLLCMGGGIFLWKSGFFQAVTSLPALQDYIAKFSPYSHLCFFLLQFLSVVIAPIPSNISAAAGGVIFGTWPAFFLTYGAVLSASLLVFLLARTLGQSFADKLVNRKISDKYLAVIRAKADVFLILAFVLPFFPDDLICILAGLTAIPTKRFLILCALGRPWGLLVASAVGGATLSLPVWAMALLGVIGLAVFLLGLKNGDKVEQRVLQKLRRPAQDDTSKVQPKEK